MSDFIDFANTGAGVTLRVHNDLIDFFVALSRSGIRHPITGDARFTGSVIVRAEPYSGSGARVITMLSPSDRRWRALNDATMALDQSMFPED